MKKYTKKDLIEYRKKLVALAATGTIALTSIAGCAAKTNTESSSEPTVAQSIVTETTAMPTTTTVEVNKDVASEEYMIQAKAVAQAMYDANKDYFDEKQFTVEDLENTYYLLNGKYYDFEGNLIMDQVELDRAFDNLRELFAPQTVTESLQKFSDLEHGYISESEYFDEINSYKFYDYNVTLSNLIDKNADNEDLVNFIDNYSTEMYKVTENLKNGVSPEDHLIEFFALIRSAQTGNITEFEGINNYLQENSADDGYGFAAALSYKAVADDLNTLIDGQFVTVQDENVRVGLSYDEKVLTNLYLDGSLVELGDYDKLEEAQLLLYELFQYKLIEIECDKQYKILANFGYIDGNVNTKSL